MKRPEKILTPLKDKKTQKKYLKPEFCASSFKLHFMSWIMDHSIMLAMAYEVATKKN